MIVLFVVVVLRRIGCVLTIFFRCTTMLRMIHRLFSFRLVLHRRMVVTTTVPRVVHPARCRSHELIDINALLADLR